MTTGKGTEEDKAVLLGIVIETWPAEDVDNLEKDIKLLVRAGVVELLSG